MKPISNLKLMIVGAVVSVAAIASAPAQTQAIWSGPSSGGEWNTPGNWTTANTPGEGTNVVVGSNTNISYNTAMVAGSFNTLTNRGTINVNAGGFVIGASGTPLLMYATAKMFVNNGGAVAVTNGSGSITTNSAIIVAAGGSFTMKNTLSVGQFGNSSSGGGQGFFTNNGGFVSLGGLTVNNSGNNQNCIAQINGGTNNLGNVTVQRGGISSFGSSVVEGLQIFGGSVNMNKLDVGGTANSSVTTWVSGGVVTNNGPFLIHQVTAGRGARFLQTGGYFVTTDPNLVTPNPPGVASGNASFSIYSITGGTNFAGGIYCTGAVNTVAGAVFITNGANIYLGSGGISSDGTVTVNANLNNGGLFGAYADWNFATASKINGASSAFTFRAADINGTPHNITVSGIISGGGQAATLNKTGTGVLTLNAANTYLGTTLIQEGTLALGPSGSIASTPLIVLSGATYDVSAVSGGYTLPAGQIISGLGVVTGAVTVASAGILNPGSNTLNGTLTFSNSITETGGATNHFDLISTPGVGNDSMVVAGDLNVSGVNYIDVSGGANGNVYPLISYGGTFTGTVGANFTVVGSAGILSNDVVTKTIYLISQNTERTPTNIAWVGNTVDNSWNINTPTNWVMAGALNHYMNGDNVLFDDSGIANSNVVLNVSVLPASVVVSNTAGTYVIAGSGAIGTIGGSLTKTGNGTLVMLATNSYTGPTRIQGGVLEVAMLANGSVNSPIGASVTDPTTLVITNGALRYTGDSVSIDRAATLGGTATLEVTNPATTLTLAGGLSGSGSLAKNGNGTLLLATANTFSGGISLNAGMLFVRNNNNALGSGDVVFNGGSLTVGTNKPSNNINVAKDGFVFGGSGSGLAGIRNITGSSNLLVSITTGVFDFIGDVSAFSGTVICSNAGGGTLRLNGSSGSKLATWDLGTGTIELLERSSASPCYFGALVGGSSTVLSGRNSSDNNGPTTYQIGDKGISTVFDGVIRNGALSGQVLSIIKSGSGTLTLSGANIYTGTTTVSNGVLALTNSGTIDNSSSITIVAGATLDASGRTDGTYNVGSAATQLLRGQGTVFGNLSVAGSGLVAPGNGQTGAFGTLTVVSNLNLSGTTWIKIDRSASPNSDRLVSTLGAVNFGGTLVVTNTGGQLQPGDTFTLFSAAGNTYTGSFTLSLPNYYSWNTANLAVNGTIQVTAILPPPSFTNVDFSTLGSGTITLNAVNGAPGGPVTIQSSTNLLTGWTTIGSTTFDGSGNLVYPVSVDPVAPQNFFRMVAR